MKTALIKTDVWDDDTFYNLNIDTKVLYLLVLTAPERGVGSMFKMSDRMLVARSGLNEKQVEVCKKQLHDLALVEFYKGWIFLTESSGFIQPVKGKLTAQLLEREQCLVPRDVFEYFTRTDENAPEPLRSGAGTALVYVNDNDDVNVNVNENDVVVKHGDTDINEAFAMWERVIGYKITSNRQKNRYACKNLIRSHGLDGVEKLIRGVEQSQADKYAPRISDFISLQSRLNDLLAWGRKVGSSASDLHVRIAS